MERDLATMFSPGSTINESHGEAKQIASLRNDKATAIEKSFGGIPRFVTFWILRLAGARSE